MNSYFDVKNIWKARFGLCRVNVVLSFRGGFNILKPVNPNPDSNTLLLTQWLKAASCWWGPNWRAHSAVATLLGFGESCFRWCCNASKTTYSKRILLQRRNTMANDHMEGCPTLFFRNIQTNLNSNTTPLQDGWNKKCKQQCWRGRNKSFIPCWWNTLWWFLYMLCVVILCLGMFPKERKTVHAKFVSKI